MLHTKSSATEPSFGERHSSFNQADVLSAAGSRYGPTATLIDVNEVLDRKEPFAFIGKPCDIGALRNYARHDPRVDELVKYRLTPVYGVYMPTPSTIETLRRFGVELDELTGLRYRGQGLESLLHVIGVFRPQISIMNVPSVIQRNVLSARQSKQELASFVRLWT